MRQEIIDKMAQVLADMNANESARNDFEKYDKEWLQDYDDPFLWCVYEYGTRLLRTNDERYINELLKNEIARYQWINGNTAVDYWPNRNGDRFFYYAGGLMFYEMDHEWCIKYLEAKKLTIENGFKLAGGEFPTNLEIQFNIDTKYLAEQVEFAKSIGDTTLDKCLERLHGRVKMADDHVITINPDCYSKHSFYFTEFYGGKNRLCGGIIYHGNPKDGYMQNGSVQLEPNYGWQIHT